MSDKLFGSVLYGDESGVPLNRLLSKKAELKEQQEFYRTSFEQAVIGMAKVALDGRFILVNPCWLNFIGYSHEEMLNLTFQDITHPADLQLSLHCMDQLINGEKDTCHYEKRFFHKNGQVLWGRLSMTLQRDAVGLPRYFIATLQDITEAKALEKTALTEAEASLQRAIMAEKQQLQVYEETRRHLGRELHDNIGQQITAVALLSDILAKDLIKEESPLYESAKKITTRLNHALSRVRQLSHGFCPTTFDHDNLIDRLKSLASETTNIHGIGCTFHYDKTSRVKDYFGYGDTPAEECHLQLFRIAQEAVTNAARHSGASQIELSLHHSSKGDILAITDNGIGISTKNHSSGLGMYSMTFRAKLVKADIVFNTLETGGTCVSICMAKDRKRHGKS